MTWYPIEGEIHSPILTPVARLIDISGTDMYQFVHFDAEVWSMRSTNARAVVLYDGSEMRTSEEHNDWYGFLSSPRNVIDDYKRYLQRFGDNPSFDIQIRVTAADRPVVIRDGERSKEYFAVPNHWWHANAEAEARRMADRTSMMSDHLTQVASNETNVHDGPIMSSLWPLDSVPEKVDEVVRTITAGIVLPEKRLERIAEMSAGIKALAAAPASPAPAGT